MNESLIEACVRAVFEIIADESADEAWLEFSGIIQNMNNGTFGKCHNIARKKSEIQKQLREYIESCTQDNDNTICDTCGCTPCDCHWGII